MQNSKQKVVAFLDPVTFEPVVVDPAEVAVVRRH